MDDKEQRTYVFKFNTMNKLFTKLRQIVSEGNDIKITIEDTYVYGIEIFIYIGGKFYAEMPYLDESSIQKAIKEALKNYEV